MITKKMKKYLAGLPPNLKKLKKAVKDSVYMNRIQLRIDRELNMLFWLALSHPDVFLDREREYSDDTGKIMSNRRLKKLLLIVKALHPNIHAELVLENLEIPDKDDPII